MSVCSHHENCIFLMSFTLNFINGCTKAVIYLNPHIHPLPLSSSSTFLSINCLSIFIYVNDHLQRIYQDLIHNTLATKTNSLKSLTIPNASTLEMWRCFVDIHTYNDLVMHIMKNLIGVKGLYESKVDKICEAAEKIVKSERKNFK